MLHIILIILKVIGLLLLGVLGLALVILLLVLLAPFRYSVDGKKGEEIYFHARVTWVLFFLRVACSYEKKKLIYYVKVFGYPLVSNEEKKERKKKKGKKGKRGKGEKKRKEEKRRKEKEKRKKKEKPLSEEEQLLLTEIEEEARLRSVELEQTKQKDKEQLIEEATKHKKIEEKPKETGTKKEKETKRKKEGKSKEKEKTLALEAFEGEEKFKEEEKRWKNPIDLVKKAFGKIRKIICESLEKMKRLFHRVDEFRQKLSELLEKLREWMEFIDEEMTKKAFSKGIKILKKLLRHILPRRIKGDLTFGLEDPAMMGRILAILGMAMPIYKDSLNVEPCFGVNMIQGQIRAKGKIRLGYLLYLAIMVLIDKEIMGTIKKARAMAKSEKERESEGGE